MAKADTEATDVPPGIDLDALSDEEVLSLVVAALNRLKPDQLMQAQTAILERKRTREQEVRNALLEEFRQRALEVGIPLEALFATGRRTRSDAGQPLPVKYRGPNGEEYSGRGRTPRWLAELEAVGHSRDEFLVKEEV